MPLTPLQTRSTHSAMPAGLAQDNYLTDGHRLFRVVSQFAPGEPRRSASLEDCLTLDVMAYTPDELIMMDLRPVRRADRDEATALATALAG